MKQLVGLVIDESGLVLNDVVIDRGLSSHMAKLDLYVNESLVTTVTGDGLILATSTGSTAYSAGRHIHAFTPFGHLKKHKDKKRLKRPPKNGSSKKNLRVHIYLLIFCFSELKIFFKVTLTFHVSKRL